MSDRELGLFAILFLWVSFIILLTRWKGHKAMSLSMHGASAITAYFYFASILTVHGILVHIFMLQWFIPQFQLPLSFTLILHFTMILLYATALIPDSNGFLRRLHRIVAYTMAFMMAVLTVYIVFYASLSLTTSLIGYSVLAYMIFAMISFGLLKKLRTSYLYYQTTYIACFHIFLLAATYLQ